MGVPEAAVHIDLDPVLDTEQELDHAALFLVSIEGEPRQSCRAKTGATGSLIEYFTAKTVIPANLLALLVGATPVADAHKL